MEVIVIDNGSHLTKIGFAGDDAPREYRSIVSTPVKQPLRAGTNWRDWYAGYDVFETSDCWNWQRVQYPIINGIMNDWDKIDQIWHHGFYNVLRAAPEEHELLITESPFNTNDKREEMTQILFETFYIPTLCLENTATLALWGSGRTRGIVCDSGHDQTSIVAVTESEIIDKDYKHQIPVGGNDIDQFLYKVFIDKGYDVKLLEDMKVYETKHRKRGNVIMNIKHKLGYIAMDYRQEMKKDVGHEYKLPDGKVIEIKEEIFRSVEGLFDPTIFGKECDGIDKALREMVLKVTKSTENADICSDIVFCGGNTLFNGFESRLSESVGHIFRERDECLLNGYLRENYNEKILYKDIVSTMYGYMHKKINTVFQAERKYLSWLGASIYGSMCHSFATNWIYRADYDEIGPSIIHRQVAR